jgi:hypothetical protein
MVNSLAELASSTWGSEVEVLEPSPERFPKGIPGSYIALVGDRFNFEFGVASLWSGCETLAKKLLFMENEEVLDESEVADAMNEIANMIGGGVKRRMSEFDAGLKLGLPTFFEGPITPTSEQDPSYAAVVVEGVTAYLVALKHRAHSQE